MKKAAKRKGKLGPLLNRSGLSTRNGSRQGWMVSNMSQTLYLWRMIPCYLLSMRLSTPQNWSGCFGEEKSLLILPEDKPQFPIHLAHTPLTIPTMLPWLLQGCRKTIKMTTTRTDVLTNCSRNSQLSINSPCSPEQYTASHVFYSFPFVLQRYEHSMSEDRI